MHSKDISPIMLQEKYHKVWLWREAGPSSSLYFLLKDYDIHLKLSSKFGYQVGTFSSIPIVLKVTLQPWACSFFASWLSNLAAALTEACSLRNPVVQVVLWGKCLRC